MNATTKENGEGPSGIGGWLALLIVILLFTNPILTIGGMDFELSMLEKESPSLKYSENWRVLKSIAWSSALISSGLSLFAGMILLKYRTKKAVQHAVYIIWAAGPGIYMLVMLAFINSGINFEGNFVESLLGLIKSIFFATLWTFYLRMSTRVKNTYLEQKTLPTASNARSKVKRIQGHTQSPGQEGYTLYRACFENSPKLNFSSNKIANKHINIVYCLVQSGLSNSLIAQTMMDHEITNLKNNSGSWYPEDIQNLRNDFHLDVKRPNTKHRSHAKNQNSNPNSSFARKQKQSDLHLTLWAIVIIIAGILLYTALNGPKDARNNHQDKSNITSNTQARPTEYIDLKNRYEHNARVPDKAIAQDNNDNTNGSSRDTLKPRPYKSDDTHYNHTPTTIAPLTKETPFATENFKLYRNGNQSYLLTNNVSHRQAIELSATINSLNYGNLSTWRMASDYEIMFFLQNSDPLVAFEIKNMTSSIWTREYYTDGTCLVLNTSTWSSSYLDCNRNLSAIFVAAYR